MIWKLCDGDEVKVTIGIGGTYAYPYQVKFTGKDSIVGCRTVEDAIRIAEQGVVYGAVEP